MIRRPPRSTLDRSSAASDVYKRQALNPAPILDLMERTLRAGGFEVAIAYDRSGLDKSVQEAIPILMIIGEKFAGQDGLSIADELLIRFPTSVSYTHLTLPTSDLV